MDLSNLETIIAVIVAAASFVFGVLQYLRAEKARHEDRRVEAARPFLELQLDLYKQATSAAAVLSTSDDSVLVEQNRELFNQLYFGQLSMVEDAGVETAMVRLHSALTSEADQAELQSLSLVLAHACRASLAKSWNTSAWVSR